MSLEVLVMAAAVIGGALARERDVAGQQAGSFERILSSLHSVVLTERVWPDESSETVFLGPGYERLLGRPATRDTTRRAAYEAMHPADRSAVAANAAYATLASGRETSVDWRVPREMGGYRWLRTRLMPRSPRHRRRPGDGRRPDRRRHPGARDPRRPGASRARSSSGSRRRSPRASTRSRCCPAASSCRGSAARPSRAHRRRAARRAERGLDGAHPPRRPASGVAAMARRQLDDRAPADRRRRPSSAGSISSRART